MDTFPLDPDQPQTSEALTTFLEGCRLRAEAEGAPVLVSIAAEASALDPLAVLESIYESGQPHFYVERKQDGLAIAGAEEAIKFSPSGPGRFERSKAFIEQTLNRTIAVGNSALPFFGPHFFCAYTFFEGGSATGEAAFPPSTIFVPRWQVSVARGRCVATANALIDANSDIAAIATRIWNANTKFRSFDYASDAVPQRSRLELLSTTDLGGPDVFKRSVETALSYIANGSFKKIVLARALDLKANQPFHPLEILNTLRERYADCYAFSIANGKGQSFIGASPERLVSARNGWVNVDVLAGTAPRGATASEDAHLGNALLRSVKDLREHRYVYDSICRRLAPLGIETSDACRPTLKKLQNVQHLHVDIAATLPNGTHLMDLVEALHPTPAVGGMPREQAVPKIPELEPFERGLYAGAIGWVDARGEGEFLVAIRSALVDGNAARLFAGVGIVDGSEPEREFEETNLKFRALMENLL